ncbi:MAG: hypothetical protein ACOH5I_01800 [Oligoflexus sp.]
MGNKGYGFSIFLQNPLKSAYYYKVFHFDYGLMFPLLFFNMTNSPDSNTAGAYSVDSQGNILRNPAIPIEAIFLGLQPTFYLQAGLTIPYLPWILFSIGGGPEFLYGKLKIDGHKEVSVQSLEALGLYLELETSVFRSKKFYLSVYARILASSKKDELDVINGEDYQYRLESSNVSSFGVRAHFP